MDASAPPKPFPSTGDVAPRSVCAETSTVDGVQLSAPRHVSRRYASGNLVPPTTRFVASDEKATKRPLKLSIDEWLLPFGAAPATPTDTSCAPPAERGLMTNSIMFDVPAEVETETCAVPGMPISAAET